MYLCLEGNLAAPDRSIRILDIDALSHIKNMVDAVLLTAQLEKKKKYLESFVVSVDGVLGCKSSVVIKDD